MANHGESWLTVASDHGVLLLRSSDSSADPLEKKISDLGGLDVIKHVIEATNPHPHPDPSPSPSRARIARTVIVN